MDRDFEHDPHENDLYEFITHLGQWWERHGRTTLLALLILAAAFAAWRWVSFSRQSAHEDAWAGVAGSAAPQSYLAVAAETKDPGARNLARLRGGDLAAREAALPQGPEDPENAGRTPEQLLDQATRAYQAVLDDAEAHVIFRLNAMLGLAAVAETRHQWDVARNWYDKVEQTAGDLYPAHREQAVERREMLAQLAEPLTFAPDAGPVKPEAAEPPGSADPDPSGTKPGGTDDAPDPGADSP